MATCAACSAENRPGAKFCVGCGRALELGCPACGTPYGPDDAFCGECGAARPTVSPAPRSEPVAERRLVSVLFADLVGFTAASEQRDAEDTRELLTRYFETCRVIVERFGGTVEKFIGDAVMAVWGTPAAHEDDAERAVRAALDLLPAVTALGAERGEPRFEARVGVLTGEAAVTVGAEGQGMVMGDLVNTASRVQAAAEPGTIVVGEATRRAAEAAIVYEVLGLHEVRGKSAPVHLWRALRVVASRRGTGRPAALEAPFVGRERELRLVKDLFHASAGDRRAGLVEVVGVAGIGKSRLAWEFEKYADGLAGSVWWHRGRCLSYGEGVAYWALAEMLRMRARIAEDESEAEALAKLHAIAVALVPDAEEREWIEPRLQHLLGLATDRILVDRDDLHAAWRVLFERMAATAPVVLLFEDLHWADAALLDFIEHLLDRARAQPIFVLALSRPEVGERPAFGTRIRSTTALTLEPLEDDAIDELVAGLVPGLPSALRATIRGRADGIPLYAVETVRMLLDRGLLERAGDVYQVTDPMETLEVPETLHALIAARLDALEPAERRALEDAAVLGKTFTARGLAAVSGVPGTQLVRVLDALVRKELLALESDPRSPERGQYGFLQALVQRVAYETLARSDRKRLHLAAATFLEHDSGLDPDEIAEVIAAHQLDAYEAEPGAEDAAKLRAGAAEWLRRAGERAAALAAPEDASRAFERAAGLVGGGVAQARLLERAGELAATANRNDVSAELLERARALYESAGLTHDGARASALYGVTLWAQGRGEEALAVIEPALDLLGGDEPDEDVARLAAEAGRLHHMQGDDRAAAIRIEQALAIAEERVLPAVLSEALNTKGLLRRSRPAEARALLREALVIALEHGLVAHALRAYNNLAVHLLSADRLEEARRLYEEGFELASSRGDRSFAVQLGTYSVAGRLWDGDWDAALELSARLPFEERTAVPGHVYCRLVVARAAFERGEVARAAEELAGLAPEVDTSTDVALRNLSRWHGAVLAVAEGRTADALPLLEEAARGAISLGYVVHVQPMLEDAATAAADLGEPSRACAAAALYDTVAAAQRSRILVLGCARIRANAAAAAGDDDTAAAEYSTALAAGRNLGAAAVLAPVLADYGSWLAQAGRAEEAAALLDEARATFERMRAVRWLARLETRAAAAPAAAVR